MEDDGEPGEGMLFGDIGEIEHALASGAVSLHAKVKARYHTVDADNKPIRLVVATTPGRLLLSEVLPPHPTVPSSLLHKVLTTKQITDPIDLVYPPHPPNQPTPLST